MCFASAHPACCGAWAACCGAWAGCGAWAVARGLAVAHGLAAHGLAGHGLWRMGWPRTLHAVVQGLGDAPNHVVCSARPLVQRSQHLCCVHCAPVHSCRCSCAGEGRHQGMHSLMLCTRAFQGHNTLPRAKMRIACTGFCRAKSVPSMLEQWVAILQGADRTSSGSQAVAFPCRS